MVIQVATFIRNGRVKVIKTHLEDLNTLVSTRCTFSDILPAFLEPVEVCSANIRLIESAFFSLTCLSSGVKLSISCKEDSS